MRWAVHVASTEEKRSAYSVLVGWGGEEKIPLARRRLRWEDNIKKGLQEAESGHGLD